MDQIKNYDEDTQGNTSLQKSKKKKKEKQAVLLSETEAKFYLSKSRRSHRMVGFGVWLIMTGVACVTTFGGFGVMALFTSIAIAVGLFIMAGHTDESYQGLEGKPIRLDPSTYSLIESKWAGIQKRSHMGIAAGVALILLAVGMLAGLGMPVGLLLFTIGFSVYLFITSGGSSDVVDHLLSRGDYQKYANAPVIGQYVDDDMTISGTVHSEIGLSQNVPQEPAVAQHNTTTPIANNEAPSISVELQKLFASGDQFISELTIAKRYIDHPATLDHVNQIIDTTNKIMFRLEKDPTLVHGIDRFFDYYLPTTSKLVVSYSDVKKQGIQGANINTTLHKIEDALGNLVTAFQAQLERLFEHTTMDLETDITTLEMMLTKDGLLNMDQFIV